MIGAMITLVLLVVFCLMFFVFGSVDSGLDTDPDGDSC